MNKYHLILSILFLSAVLFSAFPTKVNSAIICPTQNRTEGLISAPLNPGGGAPTDFGNTTGQCVFSDQATFVPYRIPTYDDLKSIYYSQSKSTKTEIIPPSGAATQGALRSALNSYDTVLIRGDLNINADLGGSLKPAVVFIDGNLNFSGTTFTFGDANSGIVFVVKGDINIASTVTRIDAVLISTGRIYTAGAGCAKNSVTTTALTIYGSLISFPNLNPAIHSQIVFCRNLSNNTNPAEIINQQPKYLIILRDLLSDTQQKWSEIQ